jgi:hypothetical protein
MDEKERWVAAGGQLGPKESVAVSHRCCSCFVHSLPAHGLPAVQTVKERAYWLRYSTQLANAVLKARKRFNDYRRLLKYTRVSWPLLLPASAWLPARADSA